MKKSMEIRKGRESRKSRKNRKYRKGRKGRKSRKSRDNRRHFYLILLDITYLKDICRPFRRNLLLRAAVFLLALL